MLHASARRLPELDGRSSLYYTVVYMQRLASALAFHSTALIQIPQSWSLACAFRFVIVSKQAVNLTACACRSGDRRR